MWWRPRISDPKVIIYLLSNPNSVRTLGVGGPSKKQQEWRGGKGTTASLAPALSQVLGHIVSSLILVLTTAPSRGLWQFWWGEDQRLHIISKVAQLERPGQNLNKDLGNSEDKALSSPSCIWALEFFRILNPTGRRQVLLISVARYPQCGPEAEAVQFPSCGTDLCIDISSLEWV